MSTKTSTRSRAYPAVALREAVDLLQQQIEGLGRGAHDRNAIARALGYANGAGGVVGRKIAALAHFGLVRRADRLYRPSELGLALLEVRDFNVRQASLREAFLSVALFRELIDRYRSHGRVPRLLADTLVRDHRITERAKRDAAEVFMASALHAGVLYEDGRFVGGDRERLSSSEWPETRSVRPTFAEPTSRRERVDARAPSSVDSVDAQAHAPVGGLHATDDHLTFLVWLTEGRSATLVLPKALHTDDLEILRRQLDVFEQRIELDRPASVRPSVRRFPRPVAD